MVPSLSKRCDPVVWIRMVVAVVSSSMVCVCPVIHSFRWPVMAFEAAQRVPPMLEIFQWILVMRSSASAISCVSMSVDHCSGVELVWRMECVGLRIRRP